MSRRSAAEVRRALEADAIAQGALTHSQTDYAGLLAEIVTPLLLRYAKEQAQQGSERVPCFLGVEWIERARIALQLPKDVET